MTDQLNKLWGWRTFNDRLALLLLVVIPALWIVGARGWVRRWLVEPVYGLDGLLRFAYEVSARAGEKPFLLNSHKAMVRETHQRIRLNAAGEKVQMSII